jgi:hypothetical protein
MAHQISRTGLKKTVLDEQSTLCQQLPPAYLQKVAELASVFQKDISDGTLSSSSYPRDFNQRKPKVPTPLVQKSRTSNELSRIQQELQTINTKV